MKRSGMQWEVARLCRSLLHVSFHQRARGYLCVGSLPDIDKKKEVLGCSISNGMQFVFVFDCIHRADLRRDCIPRKGLKQATV